MQPLRQHQQREKIRRRLPTPVSVFSTQAPLKLFLQRMYHGRTHLGQPVTSHDHPQNAQIQPRKQHLREQDISPLVRDVVQRGVDVDVRGRVDERSRAAFDEGVVALAGEVLGDLLRVGLPVYFGVWGSV